MPTDRRARLSQGAELFDNHFFDMSPAEAGATDPQQRVLLEQAYTTCAEAGFGKATLLGRDVGVFLGIMNTDFAELMRGSKSVYAATGGTISVAAGRVSFVLGLMGPCCSVDTACSSALAATHFSALAVRFAECEEALACAVSLMLSPAMSACYSRAGMLSTDGRCKTFDARANGYVRGEGVGTLVIQPSFASATPAIETPGWLATLASIGTQQDGRSASLTAPSGAAQLQLLRKTYGRASLTAGVLEAHGTGTPLGDPTELGAVCQAAPQGFTIAGVKASTGHLEPAAGMVGLLKLAASQRQARVAANAQFCKLNPKIQLGAMRGAASLAAQSTEGHAEEVCGVSSFGYSGTIAHAVLKICDTEGPRCWINRTKPVRYRRLDYAWTAPRSPFALQQLKHDDGSISFRTPVDGSLFGLVADHVVRGSVVFPAAAHLEMARAAGGAACEGIFFMSPLVLVTGAGLWVEIRSTKVAQFEISSGEMEDNILVAPQLHTSGARVAAPGAVPNGLPPQTRVHTEAAIETGGLFAAFHASGLQYGPAYRREPSVPFSNPLLHHCSPRPPSGFTSAASRYPRPGSALRRNDRDMAAAGSGHRAAKAARRPRTRDVRPPR